MADEAVCIGPAPSNESYLVIENVINACHQTGAQAVSIYLDRYLFYKRNVFHKIMFTESKNYIC